MNPEIIVVVFAVMGGGLKYINEAFDEDTFSKRTAILMATILTVLWIGLSFLDLTSRTILLSILIGVLLTGKIDNTVFRLSTVVILAALLYIEMFLWLPLIVLSATSMIDEIGNDYIDMNYSNRFVEFFFLHRFTMKIGVFLICSFNLFFWHYLIAFLLFDISYDAVGAISKPFKTKHMLEDRQAEGSVNIKHSVG